MNKESYIQELVPDRPAETSEKKIEDLLPAEIACEQFSLRMAAHVLRKDWSILEFVESKEFKEAKKNLIRDAGLLEADQTMDRWFWTFKSLFK